MNNDQVTRTINVSGAKKPVIQRTGDSDSVSIDFRIANLSRRYKVGKIIGSGGNSTVVEAYDRDLQRKVAVKLLKAKYHKNKRAVGRFLNEARITARLQHPGVVPVYETGYIGDKDVFFSMKKVEGKTLRDVLSASAKEKKLNRLFEIFFALCETMAFAHHKGITHRDLKPENIMIEKYGSILIMDWGLAKDINEKFDDSFRDDEKVHNRFDTNEGIELTMTGEISGTPSYMSPEQALGMMNKLNQRSDVFSLGVLLYEMIAGYNPFSKDKKNNFRAIFESIKHEKPPELVKDFKGKSVRKELAAICEKCLEKLPDDRYQNAEELYKDLKKFRDNRPVSAFRTGFREELAKWLERQSKALLVAALLLTSLALTYFYKTSSDAGMAGMVELIDDKMDQVKDKDASIANMNESLNAGNNSDLAQTLNFYRLQRRSEWNTAKSLILHLSNEKQNRLQARHIHFLKENWFKEIHYKVESKMSNEANTSLNEFLSYVNRFESRWSLSSEEQLTIESYLRTIREDEKENKPAGDTKNDRLSY